MAGSGETLQFQPSEIAKIAVIVCLPYMIVHMGKKGTDIESLYDPCGYGRRSGICDLCFYREHEYGDHYFLYYSRTDFYRPSQSKALPDHRGNGSCGHCHVCAVFECYGRSFE